ncbi:amidohydrolase family protein [Bacillus benzoevorans]|uniref:Aminocarboxymuconate-semialdehyde decarboxylase n=1 Tax=Bacillus benzoevorans TaxID=1456 RepID=A0A7X0HW09_9BACI|nr:amidohydrolase family protein [Bacillus benzoevorans]MBB6447919.1 aminocarboxymuconate-semialdehyde decarboxylase [Bacillus benzoevorans]
MHDFHTHFIPVDVLNWIKENQKTVNARWANKEENKEPFLVINDKWGFELKNSFIDFEVFITQQEKVGVTHSMISPIPQLFLYDFPLEITTEISRVYNKALADLKKEIPEKISALGTVPLINPVKAAEILNEAISIGLKGAIIGPGLGHQMLSDPFFQPFFEEANRLKAILFIHPLLSDDPRLKNRMMPNLIGVPWETTVCATDLLLSGIIDKYPNIKILFAHGGGFLPYQMGRLDKGYQQWNLVSSNLQASPSEYLKRFWYDTVLWNQESIDLLVKTVGEDRVVAGSDYPFDLCVWPPKEISEKGAHTLLDYVVK